MIIANLIISSVYIGICFYLSRGLKNIGKKCYPKHPDKSVSVIVCARNEEENIGKLLDCLSKQTYPQDSVQIIIVDDRSTDKTAEIILSNKPKNLLFLQIKEEQNAIAPKKFAFEQAMKIAEGEIVVQTDADSIVPDDWIEKLTAPFCDNEISLVQGIVKYRFDNKISPILKTYQNFDFLSHGIVAAAGIGKNIPLNANANNFAFRRKTYEILGGYGDLSKATSGDDGLLMQKIWRNNNKIYFNTNSFVETKPEYSWKSLINQRKKWGAQTQFYLPKQTVILAFIFIFYCFTLLSPALLAVKILGELLFMRKGLLIFGEKKLLPHIIWISPINLFLTIYSVFSGIFTKFEWKGSKLSGKIKRKENL